MSNLPLQKLDKRIQKTRLSLCFSLFHLLESTPFSKITVNDICEQALVSRATFYLHFEDKYHLLRFMMEQVRTTIDCSPSVDPDSLIIRTLSMIQEKPNLYKNLFLGDTNSELSNMLTDMFVQNVTEKLLEKQQEGFQFKSPINVLAVYIAGGIAHTMSWWVKENFPVSKEELVFSLQNIGPLSIMNT